MKRKLAAVGASGFAIATVAWLLMVGNVAEFTFAPHYFTGNGDGWITQTDTHRLHYEPLDAVRAYDIQVSMNGEAMPVLPLDAEHTYRLSSATADSNPDGVLYSIKVRDLSMGEWSGQLVLDIPPCDVSPSCGFYSMTRGGTAHYMAFVEADSVEGFDMWAMSQGDTTALALGPEQTLTMRFRSYNDSLGIWNAPSNTVIVESRRCAPAPPDTTFTATIDSVKFASGWQLNYYFNEPTLELHASDIEVWHDGEQLPTNSEPVHMSDFKWRQFVGTIREPGTWRVWILGEWYEWEEQ